MFRASTSVRRRSTRTARATLAAAALAAATAVATAASGCRDVTAPEQDPATVTYAPALNVRIADFTRDTSGIYYLDIATGSGLTVVTGSTVAYRATGYLADGRSFFSNLEASTPLLVVVGSGEVVRGFDRGLLGMNKGGRRRIVMPPALGYGNTSRGTAIPAGSILIFDVDAVDVTAPATTTPTTTASASARR